MSMDYSDDSKQSLTVIATLNKPRTLLCTEGLFFANSGMTWFRDEFFHGTHTFIINLPTTEEIPIIDNEGLGLYLFCESYKEELVSVLTTVKAMLGGMGLHGKIQPFEPKIPDYQEKASVEFLKWSQNWILKERAV